MHRDFQRTSIYLHQQVVVVNALALEGITGLPLDGICVSAASSGHEVEHTAVLMAFIVVNMPGEYDEACTRRGLTPLEHLRKVLLWCTRRMSATEKFYTRRTGVRRMMKDNKNEIDVARKRVEL